MVPISKLVVQNTAIRIIRWNLLRQPPLHGRALASDNHVSMKCTSTLVITRPTAVRYIF